VASSSAARPAAAQAAAAPYRGAGPEEGEQPDARPRVGEDGRPPPCGGHQSRSLSSFHAQTLSDRDFWRGNSSTQGDFFSFFFRFQIKAVIMYIVHMFIWHLLYLKFKLQGVASVVNPDPHHINLA
jgi:hypothetical protein